MIVGCYTLDLYCDNAHFDGKSTSDGIHQYNEFPKQYIHELGSACKTMARKDGWILRRDGVAICPKCSKKKAR